MKKALVFVKEWNGRQVGEIERVTEQVPAIFLLSDKICTVVDAPENFNSAYHEAVLVAEQAAKWTKEGEQDVFEQPMIDNGQGNMIPDESWLFVAAIPEHWEIQENAQKKTDYEQAQVVANVQSAVSAAISFGQKLMSDFVTENVMLGITQAGKTKAVRQAFVEVMSALQTGSLYDAIDEAKLIPLEAKDPVFVTDARILSFVNKIETYLQIPLSESL